MKTLIIHSASKKTFLAFHDGSELYQCTLDEQQSAIFPEGVDSFLTSLGLTIFDLERIAVCSGPGSFTGLRISALYAQTLAFERKIPLFSFPAERFTADFQEILHDLTQNSKPTLKIEISY